MKIAICISGHIRTFEKTFPSLEKHILSKYDCDIFIATYPTLGSRFSHIKNVDGEFTNQPIDLNKIKNFYKPKEVLILDDNPINSYYNPKYQGLQLGQFRIIKATNDLKIKYELNNNFEYDLVLRLRPDLQLHSFNFNQIDINCINIPKLANAWKDGITDQIAIGSSKLMNVYSEYYSNIEKISQYKVGAHPEIRLKKWIEENNIKLNNIDIEWSMVRLTGEVNRMKKDLF